MLEIFSNNAGDFLQQYWRFSPTMLENRSNNAAKLLLHAWRFAKAIFL